jgi:hypothetical protein
VRLLAVGRSQAPALDLPQKQCPKAYGEGIAGPCLELSGCRGNGDGGRLGQDDGFFRVGREQDVVRRDVLTPLSDMEDPVGGDAQVGSCRYPCGLRRVAAGVAGQPPQPVRVLWMLCLMMDEARLTRDLR